MLLALDYILTERPEVDVVNMSFAVAGCFSVDDRVRRVGHDSLRERVLSTGLIAESGDGRRALPVVD